MIDNNIWKATKLDMKKAMSEPNRKSISEYITEDKEFIYLQMKENKGSYYPIEKDRCRSYSSILSWVLHLSKKGWVTKEMLSEFIIRATNHAGLSPHVIGEHVEPTHKFL